MPRSRQWWPEYSPSASAASPQTVALESSHSCGGSVQKSSCISPQPPQESQTAVSRVVQAPRHSLPHQVQRDQHEEAPGPGAKAITQPARPFKLPTATSRDNESSPERPCTPVSAESAAGRSPARSRPRSSSARRQLSGEPGRLPSKHMTTQSGEGSGSMRQAAACTDRSRKSVVYAAVFLTEFSKEELRQRYAHSASSNNGFGNA